MGTQDITVEMRQRMRRLAPAAIARRSPAYFGAMWMNVLQFAVLGAVGLLGLYRWRWPPLDYVLLLIAAGATGMVMDTLRYLMARGALLAQVERHNDDNFVWSVAAAVRRGATTVDSGQLWKYRAGVGVLIDWVAGGLGLALIGLLLFEHGADFLKYVTDSRGLLGALALTVALAVAAGFVSIWNYRRAGKDGAVLEFAAGARGAFLLVLAVAMLLTRKSEEHFFNLVALLNGATLVLALFAVLGLVVMRNDVKWLRAYLRERPT
jgi:uncharacterized membrane protein YeaQ/YmgE (transglycosylase-associated protein family)